MMLKKWGIWFLILFFAFLYSIYSVVRHLRIETYIFDLGYYDQLIWLVSRGKPLFSSVLGARPWSDHFSPSIFLLVPLFWLGGGAKTLVTFQAIFVCLGAYPIYLLSLKKTKQLFFSITLAFSYLMFYGIQNAIAFDFHAVTLGSTLLAFIFWFYEEKRFKLFWLVLLIFVGLQENFFILAAALGVFLIVKYRDVKRGSIITLGSLVIVTLLLFVISPKYFGQNYMYLPEHLKNFDLKEMFSMLYYPNSKIDVVVYSFIGFGILPFFNPVIFILLAEEFLGRFLGTTNNNWWILGFHYNAILAPIMAYGAIETVKKYFHKSEMFAVIMLLIGVLISQVRVKTDIYKMFNRNYYDLSKTKDENAVMSLIPPLASVAATNDLGAQIAHRQQLLFISDCVGNYVGSDRKPCYRIDPDYYFANLDPNGSLNNYYPQVSRQEVMDYLFNLLVSGKYQLVIRKGDVYLLKRTT